MVAKNIKTDLIKVIQEFLDGKTDSYAVQIAIYEAMKSGIEDELIDRKKTVFNNEFQRFIVPYHPERQPRVGLGKIKDIIEYLMGDYRVATSDFRASVIRIQRILKDI
jgi:hypothetical protein